MPRVSEVPRVVELGLTSDQAARLLTERGPNRLPVQHPTPWWRPLAAEMVHFFALLFWVAGGWHSSPGLPQLGIAIFVVVVVLNGVFAFAQEERAQHAAEGLRQMLPRRATVLRDGVTQHISADEPIAPSTRSTLRAAFMPHSGYGHTDTPGRWPYNPLPQRDPL